MSKNKLINIVLIIYTLSTIGLVITEINTPGYCPTYPFIYVPACFVILTYFLLMLIGQGMKRSSGNALFYLFGFLTFWSSIYFSYNEIMGTGSCPRAFKIPIPLCFTVFPAVGLMFYWKIKAKQ